MEKRIHAKRQCIGVEQRVVRYTAEDDDFRLRDVWKQAILGCPVGYSLRITLHLDEDTQNFTGAEAAVNLCVAREDSMPCDLKIIYVHREEEGAKSTTLGHAGGGAQPLGNGA